jgi:hypothetical protein
MKKDGTDFCCELLVSLLHIADRIATGPRKVKMIAGRIAERRRKSLTREEADPLGLRTRPDTWA